jgi:hypothetical protein
MPSEDDGELELKARVPFRARITPKGIWLFISILTTGTVGPIALARWSGVATQEDTKQVAEAVEQLRTEYGPKVKALDARITLSEEALQKLAKGQEDTQLSVDKGRAESIANIAADRVRDARRSRQVRELVFERALDNLQRKQPIHSGLDEYLR